MPIESINYLLIEKNKKENRDELILRVISRDLTSMVLINSQGKAKIEDLDKILNKFDNPVKIETEEEILARIEKVFKGKIQR